MLSAPNRQANTGWLLPSQHIDLNLKIGHCHVSRWIIGTPTIGMAIFWKKCNKKNRFQTHPNHIIYKTLYISYLIHTYIYIYYIWYIHIYIYILYLIHTYNIYIYYIWYTYIYYISDTYICIYIYIILFLIHIFIILYLIHIHIYIYVLYLIHIYIYIIWYIYIYILYLIHIYIYIYYIRYVYIYILYLIHIYIYMRNSIYELQSTAFPTTNVPELDSALGGAGREPGSRGASHRATVWWPWVTMGDPGGVDPKS